MLQRKQSPENRPDQAPAPAAAPHRKIWRRLPWWQWLLGIVLVVIFLFPFYWVIVTSLNGANQVLQFPPVFLPHGQWQNYTRAWSEAPWLRYFANTIFIAGVTTLLVLITSILAGFAFGTMQFWGKSAIFAGFIAMMMIPQTVLLIPDYLVLRDLHWLNTYWAQIVPWSASVFGIFLLRQYFLSFPRELIEAARLDGATETRFIWKIAVPMAKPALITIALYVFLGSWNSFLWPYIMTQSPSVQPIEVGLATFLGTNGTDWTGLSAAVVFTTLPVMILFLVAQRQFLAGAYAATGGVKG
jgi:multiple sugar transport system permease protein